MRIQYPLLALALLCGCLASPPAPETTTTTLSSAALLSEADLRAQEYLASLDWYVNSSCRNLVRAASMRLACPRCWNLTYTLECGIQGVGGLSTIKAAVETSDGSIRETHQSSGEKLCILDADCIPGRPKYDVRYYCDNGGCVEGKFEDNASLYCLERGNKLIQGRHVNGGSYTLCAFRNGNTCEEWSYYLGSCAWNSSNLSDCSGYAAVKLCDTEYNPVCAKSRVTLLNGSIEYGHTTYSNACIACTLSEKAKATIGYEMGDCTTTTTTLPSTGVINAASNYCEQKGYAYRIRLYPSGKEHGVCVFSVDDECDAQEYFQGRCGPKLPK